MSSLAGLENLVDCTDFFNVTLELNFEDGWEPIWNISPTEVVDIDEIQHYFEGEPIALYSEYGSFKISLDIPQHWFEGTLRLKTKQQGDSITVEARIALRNAIDYKVI
jgi:hypothetical protein